MSSAEVVIGALRVKLVFVATSLKQAACIEQACIHFPKRAKSLKSIYFKEALVVCKHVLIISYVLAQYRLDCTKIRAGYGRKYVS